MVIVESAPPVIDLDVLLSPISDDRPSGESQSYSGLYDEIKEARRSDDNMAQGDWQRELKTADWRKVIETSVSALQTVTKDLQVAAWLSEALVKQHGFAGMRDSLRLIRGFHENFWDSFYPEKDVEEVGNEFEARANALEFFDRQAAFAVKEAKLTAGDGLSFMAWEESKQFDVPENFESLEYEAQQKILAVKAEAESQNKITGEMWRKSKNQTKRAFVEVLSFTVEECWQEFELLDRTMDDRFGRQTPGLGQLKKALDAIRDLVKKLLAEKRQQEPDESDFESESSEETMEVSETGEVISGGTSGAIRSRQDSLKRLSEVAEFLRRTEPHSPVSYLVQRAVKWGNMSFDEVLRELVKDDTVLGQVRETLGIAGATSGYADSPAQTESSESSW